MDEKIILPVSGQFEITERCNHNCFHCYNHSRDFPNEDSSNLEIIAKKICDEQIFNITLTGGEPFLREKSLFNIAEIFNKYNVDFEINTNLTLVSGENLQRLKKSGLKSILTSIHSYDENLHDSITQKRGSFKNFLRGIESVKKESIPLSVNMVVTSLNKNQIFDTGSFLVNNYKIESFCATPIVCSPERKNDLLRIKKEDYVRALDNLIELKETYGINVDSLHPPIPCIFEKLGRYSSFLVRSCVAGMHTFTISPLGEVRPCSNSGENYGNILNKSLKEIIHEMEKWRGKDLIPESCSPCDYVDKCRGGCRVMAASLKDYCSSHPFCSGPITKAIDKKEESKSSGIPKESYVKLSGGALKVREEENGLVTAYLSPRINALMKKEESNLLRLMTSNVGDLKEISDKYNLPLGQLQKYARFFADRKFITIKFK